MLCYAPLSCSFKLKWWNFFSAIYTWSSTDNRVYTQLAFQFALAATLLPSDFILYGYDAVFKQVLLKASKNFSLSSFIYWYKDDVSAIKTLLTEGSLLLIKCYWVIVGRSLCQFLNSYLGKLLLTLIFPTWWARPNDWYLISRLLFLTDKYNLNLVSDADRQIPTTG